MTEIELKKIIFEAKNKIYIIPEDLLLRGGDGILGNSFERILNITENNNSNSDFNFSEIKTKDITSKANDTLIPAGGRSKKGKIKPVWLIEDKFYFLKKYGTGYIDIKYGYKSSYGLCLDILLNKVIIIEEDGNIIFEITKDDIEKILKRKLENQIYVKLERVGNCFIVRGAIFYRNVSFEKFIEKIKERKIHLSNRVGENGHDHGTAFRGIKNISKELYEIVEEI